MKYKICIVADVPNWAFDSIAKKLKIELSNKYDIRIAYFNRRTESEYFYEFIEKNDDCDLIHFLNRRTLLLMGTQTFKEKVVLSSRDINEYIKQKKNKFSTAVYDYMDLDSEGIEKLKKIYNDYTKMYYTSTKDLFKMYKSIKEFREPDEMIHDIYDEKIFVPINIDRFKLDKIEDREIIVGWVGNSVHSGQTEVDLKGFNSIIKPVIQELQEEGYNIKGHYADRNDKWRLESEMPHYYSEIDICLCASIHEGTPRPVLEAMSCGVPIISTNVGVVSEAFGCKQAEFIIGNRENGKNDDAIRKLLKQKIKQLYNNRTLFEELSKENMNSIVEFDGGKTIKKFEEFFDKCLKNK